MLSHNLSRLASRSLFYPSVIFLAVIVWFVIHIPILNYGTEPLPIHAAYVGDEQGPINGALHILEEQNLLALRGAYNTQYGPLISLMAIVPAVLDFGQHVIKTGSFDPDSYKNSVIWNWTSILYFGRLLALSAGAAALCAVFLIVRRFGIESRQLNLVATSSVLLLALNWHFFEYSTYYRHWIFVVAILLWQIYFLVRLRQEEGKGFLSWAMVALLPILSFGVSYFGIFFQVLWLPILIEWIWKRQWVLLKKFLIHGLVVLFGGALIIAWVPGPFYRAVGIGYGDISDQGVGEFVNEDYGSSWSFSYYGEVVGANNIALLLALILIGFSLWRYRVSTDWVMISSVAFAAISYFVFFSIQSHHEPRYILPAIVLLILLTGIGLALLHKQHWPSGLWMRNLIIGLLLFQVIFHSIHIVQASRIFASVVPEQAVLDKLLPVLAKEGSGFKVLALRDNPFGYPHSKESYDRYAKRFGFSDRGLFNTLETTAVYPTDRPLLNFDYFSYFHLPVSEAPDLTDYDLIIARHRPNEPDVPNDRDLIDVNIVNWWYPHIAREQNWLICVSETCRNYEDTF